jgi:hypothetical protein
LFFFFLLLVLALKLLVLPLFVLFHLSGAFTGTKIIFVFLLVPEVVIVDDLRRGSLLDCLWHLEAFGDICLRGLSGCLSLGIILFSIITVQDTGIDIGGRGDLGIVQEEEDGTENGLNTLKRGPTLIGLLSGLLVLTGSMQDGDANLAIRIDVRVENWSLKLESRRIVWVVVGEGHLGLGEWLAKVMGWGVQRTRLEVGTIEGAVRIDDHEADAPFEESLLVELRTC